MKALGTYYILDGEKRIIPTQDLSEWGRFFEYDNNRIVAKTDVNYKNQLYEVSTVFLGIDHGFNREDDEPILFETMIFTEDNADMDQYQERHKTWQQAKDRHEVIVKLLTEGIDPTGRRKLILNLKQNP